MASKRNRQRADAREQLRLKQQADRRRRRIVVVVIVIVVVALILAGVAVWAWMRNRPLDEPTAAPTSTATATEEASPSGPTEEATITPGPITPPNGTAEMGWIEMKSPDAKPDALIVDEHTDYQCPWCQLADSIFGEPFKELIDRGDIVFRFHIRTAVGDRMIHNDSSVRAAMAATCADVVGRFLEYHETVFINQPPEGDGFTDEQLLVDFPAQAGINGADLTTFLSCYNNEQTKDYVVGMEDVNWNSTTINGSTQDPVHGTPVFFVNGVIMELGTMIEQVDGVWRATFNASPDGLLAHLKTVAGSN